jgi:CBS domain-containing protein
MNPRFEIPLGDVMTGDLIFLHPDDSLRKVDEIFDNYTIHHIPVVDEEEKLLGIVSRIDFLKANELFSLFNDNNFSELTVSDIMTASLTTAEPADTIAFALGVFQKNLIHALPVVEDEKLVGLVTTYDILDYFINEDAYAKA